MRFCHVCAFDRNDDTAERCRQCGADLEPIEEDEDEAETESAWFHYLQIPGVGTVELVPGRALRMGREARNELVIPRATADQIATIFWTDDFDEATLREMGSDDHIKVDGVKITGTRTLKGGEDLNVGPLQMSYLRKATRIANAIDAKKATTAHRPNPNAGVPDPSRDAGAQPLARHTRPAPSPSGPAARKSVGAPPATVCQALEVKKTSGTLRVQTPEARGWITVSGGRPRHAAFGGVTGLDALFTILRLERARVNIVPGVSAKGVGAKIELSFGEAIAKAQRPAVPPVPRAPTPAPRGPAPTGRPTPAGRPAPTGRPTPGVRPGGGPPSQGVPPPRPANPGTGRVPPPRPGGAPPPSAPPRPSSPPRPSPGTGGGGPPRRPPPPGPRR